MRWLWLTISAHPELETTFKDRYANAIRDLKSVNEHLQKRLAQTERLSVLVYLENHEQSEPGQSELLPMAVDAAIFMALKDTDPDQQNFRTEQEIVSFVESFFPAVKSRASQLIPARLAHLRTKAGNPRIRYHSGEKYALPYEVRSDFSSQNALLKQVDSDFWASIRTRAQVCRPGLSTEHGVIVEDAVSYALSKTFEKQGMNLLAASQGADTFEEIRTYEFVRESLAAATTNLDLRDDLQEVACDILRKIFYSGNEAENQYLFRLFKLYSIDFVIRGDDKVWRYFKNLARGLHLVVGTDILVRALSESCVFPASQATQNALRILKSLGVKLILSEHVLHEVYTHIRATDREFETFYKPWASHATLDEAKQSPKILIRAYFYARLEPVGHARHPGSWDEFLSQFGSAGWFRDNSGEAMFAAYLQNKYGLEFLSRRDVDDIVPQNRATALAERLLETKNQNIGLAQNDALMMLYVQEMRSRNGENFSTGLYGFATWWLTEEFHAVEIAKSFGLKDRLKMHPQFLMNFVAAIPSVREIADRNANAFPTIFGLRITNRVGDETFKEFAKQAVDAMKSDEAAAQARIRDLANKLMAKRR